MPPRKKGKKRSSTESKDENDANADSATDLLSPSEVVKTRKKSQPQQPNENDNESETYLKESNREKTKAKVNKNQTKSSKKDKEKPESESKKKERTKRERSTDTKEPDNKKMKNAKEKRKPLNKKRSHDGDDAERKSVMYPCGICTKEVVDSDEAILCEAGCEFWYHRKCAGMTDIAYHLLTKEDHAEWVCDKCIATKSVPLVKMKSVLEASA